MLKNTVTKKFQIQKKSMLEVQLTLFTTDHLLTLTPQEALVPKRNSDTYCVNSGVTKTKTLENEDLRPKTPGLRFRTTYTSVTQCALGQKRENAPE